MRAIRIAVDIILEFKKGIVLIYRKNYPKGYALPGGFVNYNESLEKAAVREAKEETSLKVKLISQLHTYSDPKRDPRGHVISTIFIAKGYGKLKAKSDAKKLKVFKLNQIPKLRFDHNKIVKDYRKYLSGKIKNEIP